MRKPAVLGEIEALVPGVSAAPIEQAIAVAEKRNATRDDATRQLLHHWLGETQSRLAELLEPVRTLLEPYRSARDHGAKSVTKAEADFKASIAKLHRHWDHQPVGEPKNKGEQFKHDKWKRDLPDLVDAVPLSGAHADAEHRRFHELAIEQFVPNLEEVQRTIAELVRTFLEGIAAAQGGSAEEVQGAIRAWVQEHPDYAPCAEHAIAKLEEWQKAHEKKRTVLERPAQPEKPATPKSVTRPAPKPERPKKEKPRRVYLPVDFGGSLDFARPTIPAPNTIRNVSRGPSGGFEMTFSDADTQVEETIRMPFDTRERVHIDPYSAEYLARLSRYKNDVSALTLAVGAEDWVGTLSRAETRAAELDRIITTIFPNHQDRAAMCIATMNRLDQRNISNVRIDAMKGVQQQWLAARIMTELHPDQPPVALLAENDSLPLHGNFSVGFQGEIPQPATDDQLRALIEELSPLEERQPWFREYVRRMNVLLGYSTNDGRCRAYATRATQTFEQTYVRGWTENIAPIIRQVHPRARPIVCRDSALYAFDHVIDQTSVLARFQTEGLARISAREGKLLAQNLLGHQP